MMAITSLEREEARALLSVLGALLAAYGFFYTGAKDRLKEAAEVDWTSFDTKRDLRPSLDAARSARVLLVLLAACAGIVVALFLPVTAPIVVDVGRSRPYAPDKAALVVVVVFWAGLAVVMCRRIMDMTATIHDGMARLDVLPAE